MALSYQKIQELIGSSWAAELATEFDKPYMNQLMATLKQERSRYDIYPIREDVFNAYHLTPLDQVQVVIIGQDPYHTPGHAHGLAFSVADDVNATIPPSLKNILTEVGKDMNSEGEPFNTNLERWAKQGVFLLNSILTVRRNQPLSHAHIGWQEFTKQTVKVISERFSPTVFMLWGKQAQEFKNTITFFGGEDFHLILEASHPSPYSYNISFKDSMHFKKANDYLKRMGKHSIQW